MAQKTYLIGLYLAGVALHRYMARWQPNIMEQSLTQPQIDAFTDCLACVTSLIELFRPSAPTP